MLFLFPILLHSSKRTLFGTLAIESYGYTKMKNIPFQLQIIQGISLLSSTSFNTNLNLVS